MKHDDPTNWIGQGPDNLRRLDPKIATQRSRIALDVLDHWESLRRGRDIPRRSDLSPSALGSALPFAFLLERRDPGLARFCLAGHHLDALMGRPVKGLPVTAFCAPGTKAELLPLLDAVFDTPASLSLDLVARSSGHPPKAAELLVLPLRDRDGRITRALGCLVARGPILFVPYRFAITHLRCTVLAQPAPQPPTAKRLRATGVPYLRIVD